MIQGHKNKLLRVRLPLLFTFVACFAFTAAVRVHASAEDQIDQAVAASKTWVAQIDAGKYEDSYSFACDETRDKFPEDKWVDVLKAIRKQWGSVIDRHQLSHVYKPHGVRGLDGECVVITYNTNFTNLDNATETVVLKWEDGQWRGAGYFAGATPDPNATPMPVTDSSTEIHTDEHFQPVPQSPAP
jgi:hypothetical protein